MRAVTCVLYLAKVFQFIEDGFNQGSSFQERLVEWCVLYPPLKLYCSKELGGLERRRVLAGCAERYCAAPATMIGTYSLRRDMVVW